ncbi:response regulator [Deinococcus soli (ex Cha et al. 2016)]|uniref:CheY-like chemotaxis protein n=2 Tax=Deinococcus soli (ex Cha et al. 2016) TaxID=1309411 RepID=A0AAE4BPE2_9DEIO|nr:response regulator [Deinococcus soli (ex Cha et al. 2016)]MDR6220940.1 CheY-like chemotaxis protein [Deinococcus soli (ex Cha et al. 2016)]MDR6330933.1 CheY-like chemotaxis protein [Deinococcus soli (ex Cha et al. 2016)]MDR6753662.1 CheY-like chemotaxis protein [Deinococcus soli (ex Cha et al. 2016)]
MNPLNDGRYLSILLIDDNSGERHLIQEALAQQRPPVWIETCSAGRAGVERLRAHAAAGTLPDVLLLDLRMPDLDGFDVLRLIRKDPDLQALPVVILTGSGSPNDLDRAFHLKTTAYLVKSPSFPDLVRQMRLFTHTWMQVKYPEPPGWA